MSFKLIFPSFGLGVWVMGPNIGPSEVRALPLGVAGRTKWPLLTAFFLSLLFSLSARVTFLPEKVVQGF